MDLVYTCAKNVKVMFWYSLCTAKTKIIFALFMYITAAKANS